MSFKGCNPRRNKSAQVRNSESFYSWYRWLQMVTTSIWEWNGFPKSVDKVYLEKKIFYNGWVAIFKDENIDVSILPKNRKGDLFALGGQRGHLLDINGNPLDVEVVSENGGQYRAKKRIGEDAVIIENNIFSHGGDRLARLYAERLSDLERTVDVNVSAQKTPTIFYSDALTRNTLKVVDMKINENEISIFGNKNKVNLGEVKQFNTQAPFVADKLTALQHDKLVEYFMRCGFEAFESQKKERLVSKEAEGTEAVSEGARNFGLVTREQACVDIKDTFNRNVSVRFRSELMSAINSPELMRLGMLGGGINTLTQTDLKEIVQTGVV